MTSYSLQIARRVVVTGALGALLLLGLCPPAAQATNFSGITGRTGCNDLNQADNKSHGFHYIDLSSAMSSATTWARTHDLDPTKIDTYIDTTPDAHTDVDVIDKHYVDYCGLDWLQPGGDGIVGLAKCDLLSSTRRCDRHSVRYNNNFTDDTNTSNRRGLACHENGHAVGLAHRTSDDSCMPQGYPKPALFYSDHDFIHLDTNY